MISMYLPCPIHFFAASLMVFLLLMPPGAFASPGAREGGSETVQIDKTRSLAETQHEIVLLLIKKKDYDQALAEAGKIFGMKWPPDQEPLLLKDLLLIADQFLHAGQAAVGIKLIEANIKVFKSPSSLVSIWKEKGYLYKTMGDNDRALECFRQAQKLEK